jgi:hypothetical protein
MAKSKKQFKRAPKNKKIVAPREIDKKQERLAKRFLHIEPTEIGVSGKYIKLDLRKIYRLCILGMTNVELAEHYDVKVETWNQWANPASKTWKPGLSDAINKGREDIVSRVAERLVQRALGFKHKATKMFYDSQSGEVVKEEYTEIYPPSEQAAIFILKNKRPKDWKDKQIVEGPDGSSVSSVSVTVLTDEGKIKKLLEDKARKQKENGK